MDIDKELRDLKRRLDLAETRLAQLDGRFEFVSGQLRDIQLSLHARTEGLDKRFDELMHWLETDALAPEADDDALIGIDMRLASFEAKALDLDTAIKALDGKVETLPRLVAELVTRKKKDQKD